MDIKQEFREEKNMDVSQQRELLKAFFVAIDEVNRDGSVVTDENAFIDEVIKDFNCG
tara:strand:- start:46 stop:216 length:171 start_codon:yes stop_codon:yes gene_type:complete